MTERDPLGIEDDEVAREGIRWAGEYLRSDNSWLLLGRIRDALSTDEERARSAKRPDSKADPNPDYKHRPWAQWLKRAEAGTLASTEAAVAHVKRGGLVGLVPGVHGLAVLDVDTGDPSDLERRYPPLAKAATRRGAHLFYAAPDKPLGNSNWEAEGCSGEVRCSSGYVVVWDPLGLWEALRVMAENGADKHPFPMEVLAEHRSTAQTVLDVGCTSPPDGPRAPQSNASNHQVSTTTGDKARAPTHWSQDDVVACYGDGLRRVGREFLGPCPLCGGDDRFRVTPSGKFFCRHCLPNGKDKERFRQMARALGLPLGNNGLRKPSPDREHEKRRATMDRQMAETAKERGTVGPDEDADGMIADATDRESKADWFEGLPPDGAKGNLADAITTAVRTGFAYDIGISKPGQIVVHQRGTWYPPEGKGDVSRVGTGELYALGGGSRLGVIRDAVGVLAARVQQHEPAIDFDADPYLVGLPVEPGRWRRVLDLADGSVRRARRGDYVTRSIGTIPDAIKTPLFNEALRRWAGDDERRVRMLRRIMASCLVGLQPERALFFLLGPRASGKSVFTRLVQELARDYFGALQASDIGAGKQQKPDELIYGHFYGRRGMFVPELPTSALRAAFLRAVCGGDAVQGRRLYENPWSFVPGATLMLTANALPGVNVLDSALLDRVRVIQFPRTFEGAERIPKAKLLARFQAELPGILHSLLPDAATLIHEGMTFDLDGFTTDDREAVETWALSADKLMGFGALLVHDPQGRIPVNDVWERFQRYLSEIGMEIGDWKPNTLSRALSTRGFGSPKKQGGQRFRMGVRWKRDGVDDKGTDL